MSAGRGVVVGLTGHDSLSRVQRYLPHNYSAELVEDKIVISGEDDAGWTWEDYVLPRLASGLIFVEGAAS